MQYAMWHENCNTLHMMNAKDAVNGMGIEELRTLRNEAAARGDMHEAYAIESALQEKLGVPASFVTRGAVK